MPAMPDRPAGSTVPLIAAFVAAQVGMLQGAGTFPALLPNFLDAWSLTNTDAGWINGIFLAGYTAAVPFLVSLSDRAPARRIFTLSGLLGVLSSLGFALLAEGFWTAMAFRLLGGVAVAGTYMPGLKLLSDHLEHRDPTGDHSRATAFYVSGFGLGMSISFFLGGLIGEAWGWPVAFAVSAAGPLAAVLVVALAVPRPDPAPRAAPATHLLDFRPVFRQRRAMAYVLAYTVHNFELFASRSWAVAFLAFAVTAGPDPAGAAAFPLGPATIVAIAIALGPAGSVLGNELSRKIGRNLAITGLMWASTLVGLWFGFIADWPYALVAAIAVFYCVLQVSDSASITAGTVANAPPGYRGATLAVHSTIGFVGSSAGPVVFGWLLDRLASAGVGGLATWGWAFAFAGLVVGTGPLFVRWLAGPDPKS